MEKEPIPIQELYASGADSIAGYKAADVIGSISAIVSLIASSMLIWLLMRSKKRLSTTYHRIVLGMSIADILYSLSLSTFNLTGPIDDQYYVWNVKGNQASCNAQGFIAFLGAGSGVHYSSSINLYYLAVVCYQKTDRYITSKIEPFLHGIPLFFGLLTPTVLIAKDNIKDGGGGSCYAAIYDPPHCVGYENGEIREGFTIPCGRGRDGAVIFYYFMAFITFCIIPVVICISLRMIYRAVKLQEKRSSRYGAGSLNLGSPSPITADPIEVTNKKLTPRNLCFSLCSGRDKKKDNTMSRIILHRAMAYTGFFFLTWTFFIIGVGFDAMGANWPKVLVYITNILNPMQGLFNFIIFVYPKVGEAKSKGGAGTTWTQAFASVLWSTDIKRTNNRKKESPVDVSKPQTAPTSSTATSQLKHTPDEEGKNEIDAPHHYSFDIDDIRDEDSC